MSSVMQITSMDGGAVAVFENNLQFALWPMMLATTCNNSLNAARTHASGVDFVSRLTVEDSSRWSGDVGGICSRLKMRYCGDVSPGLDPPYRQAGMLELHSYVSETNDGVFAWFYWTTSKSWYNSASLPKGISHAHQHHDAT